MRAGYSAKTADRIGSRLLKKIEIQAYLETLRQKTQFNTQITLERTLREIARVAYANVTQAMTFDCNGVVLKDSQSLPEDVTAAIESVTFTESETRNGVSVRQQIKMHNKVSALGLLADYFGIREDFNKARATLKRYGLALIVDEDADCGWRVEAYTSGGADSDD